MKIHAILSFVTNGGGGTGNSMQDIQKSASGAEVSEAINGNNLSEDRIKEPAEVIIREATTKQ